MNTLDNATEGEMLRLKLDLWHPDCWTLQATKKTEAGLLGHGVYTSKEGPANGKFTVYGDSIDEVSNLIEQTRTSPLTTSVMEIEQSWEAGHRDTTPPGNIAREIFVEFDSENSIDEAFISRGFVYDGPTRIKDGRESWSLVTHNDRQEVQTLLDEIRDEMNAEINVTGICSPEHITQNKTPSTGQLSDRQREIFFFAREQDYYEWPRGITARELAAELDISKTTFLEHLRKAESKLLKSIE